MTIDLFTPIRAGELDLANRIIMAPLTRNRAGPHTAPTPLMAEYYAQRAGAGLIISEASQISPSGVPYPNTPGIHSAAQVEGWRLVTDAVHANGGKMVLQLWHGGRVSHPSLLPGGMLPVAPSAIRPAGNAITPEGLQPFVTPRALTTAEIPGLIADYEQAARNARYAGFDGIEVHAANGYLIDQFLRDGTNTRTDRYGGSIGNRARFLIEVTEAVIGVWGEGRVGVRLSPNTAFNDMYDSTPHQTFTHAAKALDGLGIAYLHVKEAVAGIAEADRVAGAIRTVFRGALMLNEGYDKASATAALASGAADLISFGAPFIANPDLPARLRLGAPLASPDPTTYYGGDAKGYTDYPTLETVDA